MNARTFYLAAAVAALASPAMADPIDSGSGQYGPYKYSWELREDYSGKLVVVDTNVSDRQTAGIGKTLHVQKYTVTTSPLDSSPVKVNVLGTYGKNVNAAVRISRTFGRGGDDAAKGANSAARKN